MPAPSRACGHEAGAAALYPAAEGQRSSRTGAGSVVEGSQKERARSISSST